MKHELVVIGGGPAGLAAAVSAFESGISDILIIERDKELGGILNQCIHNGFGLHRFKEELTGPEYADRFIKMLSSTNVKVMTDAMVLDVTKNKQIHVASTAGYQIIEAGAIILAMGCRERTRGAIGIPGDRPAGVFTAGSAQRYLNLEGYMCGKRVVILGSGDIGLIMARRMTLEGAKVLACVEVMPYSGGLARNIAQCLNDFDIPLYLSHTVTEIIADNGRISSVTVSKVDEKRAPIPGTEMHFDCDTLLLSVGLIPENELTRGAGIEIDPRTNGAIVYDNMETSVPGIFACGNVVHVHDLVDYVSDESERAGRAAAEFIKSAEADYTSVSLKNGKSVTYTVPQKIRVNSGAKLFDVFFRVNRIFSGSSIVVKAGGSVIAQYKRDHMTPGEMEHIRLPKVLIEKANGCEIEISAEEAEK
ncbi:MAG: FAD-dependent oxidoreductase [Clostridia bacterium]|nr:FAD-dependent oxidoreductase [Clostridia bacterium]